MPAADLHTHTTCSDGRLPPAALVQKAAEYGLDVLAVTDHDTIDGVAEAQEAGRACGVQVVPGVELSVTVRHDRPSSAPTSGEEVPSGGNADGGAEGSEEIHLLGYAFDPGHEGLREHLARFKEVRRERAGRMTARLTELGHPLTLADVEAQAASGGAALGRPHVAQALVAAGHAPSARAAFDRLIGDGKPAFVRKPRFDAAEALALLHDAGGIGALAHPGEGTTGRTFRTLREAGLDAVEVVHPSHDDRLTRYWRRRAASCELQQTGGSDYHGQDEHLGRYTAPDAGSIFD
jgi:predicted metal-dependent phosphoesterase TrpH